MGSNKLISQQTIKQFVEQLGFEMVGEYKGVQAPLLIKTKEGYFCAPTVNALRNGKNPWVVSKSNPYSLQNIKNFCKANRKPFKILSNIYAGNNVKLSLLCEKCGEVFEMDWCEIKRGNGCPYCAGQKVAENNCLAAVHPELCDEWDYAKNGDLMPTNVTCHSGKTVCWKCSKCGYEWSMTISARSDGKGCFKCYHDSIKGNGSPLYKPDKTDDERRIERKYPEYKQFVLDVFKRDNYTCQLSGYKGHEIVVHHLDGYNWYKRGRTNPDNAITLSSEVHRKFHKIYGSGNNTKAQFEEFAKSYTKASVMG